MYSQKYTHMVHTISSDNRKNIEPRKRPENRALLYCNCVKYEKRNYRNNQVYTADFTQ